MQIQLSAQTLPSVRPEDCPPAAELNTKRRGELSELAFVHKAASLGFGVAKPYGDSERFDFILVSRDWPQGDKLWRVQVKSTATLSQGFYHVNAHRRTTGRVIAYKPTEVDFLVAHIIPEDSWFIFPIEVLAKVTSPSFRPNVPAKKESTTNTAKPGTYSNRNGGRTSSRKRAKRDTVARTFLSASSCRRGRSAPVQAGAKLRRLLLCVTTNPSQIGSR